MDQIFKDYLFSKHILVCDSFELTDRERRYETCFNSAFALAHLFGIRVTNGARNATEEMIRDAERNLGYYVPEPFYRGFPESVRELSPGQLIFDQLYHYTQTYGMGWLDQPGHSVLEDDFAVQEEDFRNTFYKRAFEGTEWEHDQSTVKDFVILQEYDAICKLEAFMQELSGSNRPLSRSQMDIIAAAYKKYPGGKMLAEKIPCKKTAVALMYDLRSMAFAQNLQLSDVMKLVDYIQYKSYGKEKVNCLNLKNKDRKFITDVIHEMFSLNQLDICNCYTRRKDWKGLLHHLPNIIK